MNAKIFPQMMFGLLLVLLGFAAAGCKSSPKVDWDSRVGTYTYDQAVTELGPPDRSTPLTDGKLVADWIKHSNSSVSFGVGAGSWGGSSGGGVGVGTTTGYGDKILRLTFDADHKLLAWKKNY
jgi:hypothetical protein